MSSETLRADLERLAACAKAMDDAAHGDTIGSHLCTMLSRWADEAARSMPPTAPAPSRLRIGDQVRIETSECAPRGSIGTIGAIVYTIMAENDDQDVTYLVDVDGVRDEYDESELALVPTAPAPCAPLKDYTNLNDDSAGALEEVAKRIEVDVLRRTDAEALRIIAREIHHALATQSDAERNNFALCDENAQLVRDLATARAENERLHGELDARFESHGRRARELTAERDSARAEVEQLRDRLSDKTLALREAQSNYSVAHERAEKNAALHREAVEYRCKIAKECEHLRGELERRDKEHYAARDALRERLDEWRMWADVKCDVRGLGNEEMRAAIDQKLAAKSLPSATSPAPVFTAEERDAVNYAAAYCSNNKRHEALTSVIEKIEAQLVPAAEAK